MAGKRAEKRAALTGQLIEAAVARIRDDGIDKLRARDLATDAGCALGAIYTIFDDMDALVFAAKAEMFRDLDAQLTAGMAAVADEPPRTQMIILCRAYRTLATDTPHVWTALFASPEPAELPEWYRDALNRLMAHISRPLHQLRPDLSLDNLELRTRTIFSAIHGVVLLSVQNRPTGVPEPEVDRAMKEVVDAFSSL